MTYRPLNQNEYAIVSETIYGERGLTGGLAESMFMAYKGRALALDEPEFIIFQESEVERKARLEEKQQEKIVELQTSKELEPMEFLRKLDSLSKNNKPHNEPINRYEWFFGDDSKLDARYKRLRVKFFNSPKYRKQMLESYVDDGIISVEQINNTQLIGELIGEFHRKYPATRQGIVSYYEILFGDSSNFCYKWAVERKEFHNNPEFRTELLNRLHLDENMETNDVREALKKSALETGVVTIDQINTWEEKM